MSAPPDGLPLYRVLTGPDDAAFCRRVSEAIALGYRLHEGPAVTSIAAVMPCRLQTGRRPGDGSAATAATRAAAVLAPARRPRRRPGFSDMSTPLGEGARLEADPAAVGHP